MYLVVLHLYSGTTQQTTQGPLSVYLFFLSQSELHVLHSFLVNVGDYWCGDFPLLFEDVELTQTLHQRDGETTG